MSIADYTETNTDTVSAGWLDDFEPNCNFFVSGNRDCMPCVEYKDGRLAITIKTIYSDRNFRRRRELFFRTIDSTGIYRHGRFIDEDKLFDAIQGTVSRKYRVSQRKLDLIKG